MQIFLFSLSRGDKTTFFHSINMKRSELLSKTAEIPSKYREKSSNSTAFPGFSPLKRRIQLKQPIEISFSPFSRLVIPEKPAKSPRCVAKLALKAISQAETGSNSAFQPIHRVLSQKTMKLTLKLQFPRRSLEAEPVKYAGLSVFTEEMGRKGRKRPVGLLNLGLVCYRNATFSAFYALDGVFDYFTSEKGAKAPLHDNFRLFFLEYQENAVSDHTLKSFGDLMPSFPLQKQYCAYAYFQGLLTVLDKEAEPPSFPLLNCQSLLEKQVQRFRNGRIAGLFDLFAVVAESLWICSVCGGSRRSFQFSRGLDVAIPRKWSGENGEIVNFGEGNFYKEEMWQSYSAPADSEAALFSATLVQLYSSNAAYLQCDIAAQAQNITLEDCLQYTTRATLMTAENRLICLCCGQNSQHFKVTFIRHIGSVLVIHFQRFDEQTQGKLYAKVRFPEVLEMGKYVRNSGKYRLKAVIRHNGTLEGGHYTAQIRLNRVWYSVDDSVVRRPKQGFAVTNAYILFYEACSSL